MPDRWNCCINFDSMKNLQLHWKDLKTKPDFRQILMLRDADTIAFILKFIVHSCVHSRVYWAGVIGLLFLTVGFSVYGLWHSLLDDRLFFIYLSGGIVFGSVVLVILHEWIQGILYRKYGAGKLIYKLSFKRMSFIVIATGHVINKKELKQIVYTPFLIITGFLAGLALFVGWPHALGVLMTMLVHSLYCMRDFALLSYFSGKTEFYTFDEETEAVTFAYEPMKR